MLDSMAGVHGPRDELTRYTAPETGAYYFVPALPPSGSSAPPRTTADDDGVRSDRAGGGRAHPATSVEAANRRRLASTASVNRPSATRSTSSRRSQDWW